jgi:hypothetical protein
MPDTVIEILVYSPADMDEFIPFAIDGKRDASGEFETDEQGRKIVGVLRWLHGREVPEAHFFNSAKGDPVQLFMAMIHRPESYDVPWMRRIPGFEVMVKTDGLTGKTNQFLSIADLLATVRPNNEMDEKFEQGKERLLSIRSDQRFSPGARQLLSALRGDVGSDPEGVIAEAQKSFGFEL